MKIIRHSIAALLVSSQSLSASTLDRAACDFIAFFDSNNETSFVENFLFMNHNAEQCIGGINCYRPISKRTLPVNLTIGEFLPSDPKTLEVTLLSTGNIRNWFAEITGLEVQLVEIGSVPEVGKGFILVEVVDDKNAFQILSTKTSIAHSEFKQFIEEDRVNCLALNGDWANAGLEYSEVWIKADQSYGEISQCLTEEIYHTFGVVSDPIGLASLYSDPMWLPEQTGSPNFTYPSYRDVIIMKTLYDATITNGDDTEVTVQKLAEILERDCALSDTD